MLLRHQSPDRSRDLVVEVTSPDATVADLCQALDPDQPIVALTVDGRSVPPSTPIDRTAIGTGARVERDDAIADAPCRAGWALEVLTGLDAGRILPLGAGSFVLGRGTGLGPDDHLLIADPTLSRRHLAVRVRDDQVWVEDLGSSNGTLLDGVPLDGQVAWPSTSVLRCGVVRLRLVEVAAPLPNSTVSGPPPWPHHRGLAPHEPPAEDPVPTPGDLPDPPAITPIGLIALFGSFAMAGVLVLILKSWMYAAFAGLGPILMIASSLDSRRRRRSSGRRNHAQRRSQLHEFETRLLQRRETFREQLERRHPGAASSVALAGGHHGARPDPACWVTRPDAPGAFTVRVGTGTTTWAPPVDGDSRRWPDDVQRVARDVSALSAAPVTLALEPGTPVALVGDPGVCRAVARSVAIQAAVQHGPADLDIAVFTDVGTAAHWSWVAWLPHSAGAGSIRLLANDESGAGRILGALTPTEPETPNGRSAPPPRRSLVVMDARSALMARRSAVRSTLRVGLDPTSGVVPLVIVGDAADVPAGCTVVTVTAAGQGRMASAVGPVELDGLTLSTAASAARSLARFEDPEVDDPGRGLPDQVDLAPLLGAERLSTDAIAARWCSAGPDPSLEAVLGVAVDGPLVVDLGADGPHALVAGTTGAGKSELLRSLVTSLAVGSSPDHLTFVLIDFKGGSAFDACARFPHTTGLVTDLDEHLAARALRCLDAELAHRERRLREVGAPDLTAFRATGRAGVGDPLPRLVVVIDEFATLAAELPEFVDSLVGIAQRGRSLGVHLVLATQRPAGAVSDNIRANTALRIALRVQDKADSTDVIDSDAAAALPRGRPGRGLVRLGPGELTAVQTAYVGGASLRRSTAPVTVRPLSIEALSKSERSDDGSDSDDLTVIAERLTAAWSSMNGRPPRKAWPDPLPEMLDRQVTSVDCSHEEPTDAALPLGLADDPDHQRHTPYRWRLDRGALLAVGLPGSGTSTLLGTIALTAADRMPPRDLHVYVLDLGNGSLGAFEHLPHVGAVIRADETERQRRLFARLERDAALRRSRSAEGLPQVLLLLDGLGAFRDEWTDDIAGPWPALCDLVRRGSDVGIHVAIAAEGAGRVPHHVLTACEQRLVMRLSDPADYASFGITARDVPDLVPGRGIDPVAGSEVQVAVPAGGFAHAVEALGAGCARPLDGAAPPVGVLPAVVDLGRLVRPDLPAALSHDDGSVALTVGISDNGLRLARLELAPAAHAVVVGPPRSGRTTALRTLALSASATGRAVLYVSPTPIDLGAGIRHCRPEEDLVDIAEDLDAGFIVVDDADLIDDDHAGLRMLVSERRPERHVIASARPDRLRSAYTHWLREIRVDRTGILLDADRDLDGDLIGARLPRHLPVPPRVGLGWMSGSPQGYVQVARPIRA